MLNFFNISQVRSRGTCFFCACFISLSTVISSSIHVLQMTGFHPFHDWMVLLCVYVSHFTYPFISLLSFSVRVLYHPSVFSSISLKFLKMTVVNSRLRGLPYWYSQAPALTVRLDHESLQALNSYWYPTSSGHQEIGYFFQYSYSGCVPFSPEVLTRLPIFSEPVGTSTISGLDGMWVLFGKSVPLVHYRCFHSRGRSKVRFVQIQMCGSERTSNT